MNWSSRSSRQRYASANPQHKLALAYIAGPIRPRRRPISRLADSTVPTPEVNNLVCGVSRNVHERGTRRSRSRVAGKKFNAGGGTGLVGSSRLNYGRRRAAISRTIA